jgi:hypothetical protein
LFLRRHLLEPQQVIPPFGAQPPLVPSQLPHLALVLLSHLDLEA